MKITVEVLGWKDQCCGCSKTIKGTERVIMVSGILGLNSSLHFCEECIKDIYMNEVATRDN